MGFHIFKNEFPVKDRTVLITGGSKGLGLSAGRQLAEKGANIVIVARGIEKLKEAVEYISQGATSSEQRFHYIAADLIVAAESARVIAEATAWNHAPLDIVWCCAGSCHPTLFINTLIEQFQHMMDSNYFSSVYIAHAALNAWLQTSESSEAATRLQLMPRHLIFTASFVSFYTFVGFAPYSPAKAALRSLSDSLSQEMNLYTAESKLPPVKLHTIFPATMFTESLEAENRAKTDITRLLEEGDKGQTAEEAATASIAGLERGEELVTTTLLTRLVMTGVLGGSARGGLLKGMIDTLLSWLVVIIMVFVRKDMDSKVRKWGRKHGSSGMKKA